MYGTRGAWIGSQRYLDAVAAERAYWRRALRGAAEPARVRGNARDYAPELAQLSPGWGRLAWEKLAQRIEAEQGNPVPALPFDAADAQIRDEARAAAASLYRRALEGAKTLKGARDAGEAACIEWGVNPPAAKLTDKGAIARLFSSEWWVRRLRASHGRRIEGAAQRAGYVHKGAGCYASAVAVARRQDQRARNARALESVTLVNQFEDEFTLAELAARSNANPVIRRNELMTRIAGFEAVAQGLGHAAEFWTLTAPSRFHAVTIDGEKNDKHDGSTPRDAQAWLCEAWARFRAWAHRAGVRFYGFRIAEPHHDGCPHWHMLLWMDAQDVKRARAKLVRYGMGSADHIEAPPTAAKLEREYRGRGFRPTTARWLACDEAAALAAAYLDAIKAAFRADKARRKNGFKFVAIDPARGSAAGYVAKYVAKNIDGYKLGADLYGNAEVETSERVEAWAATWGIRQFQQLGGAPVGVWRELRRVADDEAMTETVGLARKAADAGAWEAYTVLMGGPMAKRAAMPLQVARTGMGEKWDAVERMRGQGQTEAGERVPFLNCYGEPCARSVFGVRDVGRDAVVVSRRFRWERREGGSGVRQGAQPRAARTGVNNCTQGGEDAKHGSAADGRSGERASRYKGARSDQRCTDHRQNDGGEGVEVAGRSIGGNLAGAARAHVRDRAPQRGGLTNGE